MSDPIKPAVNFTLSCGPLLTMTAVVLVVLKLSGVIGISWLWALSPLWLGTAAVLAIIVLFLGALAVASGVLLFVAFLIDRVQLRKVKMRRRAN
jgi:hypothetical protein